MEKIVAFVVTVIGLILGALRLKQIGKEEAVADQRTKETKAVIKAVKEGKERNEKVDNLKPDELVNELLKSADD